MELNHRGRTLHDLLAAMLDNESPTTSSPTPQRLTPQIQRPAQWVRCNRWFGGRFRYKHQDCLLPGLGMARINRATCSGSSIWTKCRAPGIRNSSDPGRNSWNVRATP